MNNEFINCIYIDIQVFCLFVNIILTDSFYVKPTLNVMYIDWHYEATTTGEEFQQKKNRLSMGTVVNNTFGKCWFINPLPSTAERKAGSGWTRNTQDHDSLHSLWDSRNMYGMYEKNVLVASIMTRIKLVTSTASIPDKS